MKEKFFTTKRLSRIGNLGAVAALLFMIPGIPIIPPIYKLDFSTIPVLIAGFSMGPLGALCTLFIKSVVALLLRFSDSFGVGELADFLMTGALALTAAAIYRKNRTFKGAIIGMAVGTGLMVIVSGLANYFIMIPFYVTVMGLNETIIINMVTNTIPAVTNLFRLIVFATLPFNLGKALVVSLITILLYKRVSPLLK